MQRRILCTGGSGFIGAHFVEHILSKSCNDELINVDLAEPRVQSHRRHWRHADILDATQLKNIFREFQPTHLVHLAANISMDGKSLEDYPENVQGTDNVLEAVKSTPSVQRVIITSTQHVRKPGSGIQHSDEDFDPYGAYGASKVVTEQMTRKAGLKCCWTIVRPTTIWGPGHSGLGMGFFKILARRLYVHPKNDPVVRTYGYVKNTAFQLDAVLDAPGDTVNSRMYNLGDACIPQIEWVDSFARAISGKPVRTAPRSLIYMMALLGEGARAVGLPSPLFISRYKNMITTNPVPVEETIRSFGVPPYPLGVGIEETIGWLRAEGLIQPQ